jgi:hypothetical protein
LDETKEIILLLQNGFPDGEGFNALPIAFIYAVHAERTLSAGEGEVEAQFQKPLRLRSLSRADAFAGRTAYSRSAQREFD